MLADGNVRAVDLLQLPLIKIIDSNDGPNKQMEINEVISTIERVKRSLRVLEESHQNFREIKHELDVLCYKLMGGRRLSEIVLDDAEGQGRR